MRGNVKPGPALVRGVVFLTGFAALLLALPNALHGTPSWVVVAALAALPAVRPASWIPTGVELLAVFGWLLQTTAFGELVSWLPLAALAASLYLHHLGSSMAAAIPLGTVVVGSVWLRLLVRAAAVLAVTGGLAAAAVVLDDRMGKATSVAIPVIGVVVSVILAALLAVGARGRTG